MLFSGKGKMQLVFSSNHYFPQTMAKNKVNVISSRSLIHEIIGTINARLLICRAQKGIAWGFFT